MDSPNNAGVRSRSAAKSRHVADPQSIRRQKRTGPSVAAAPLPFPAWGAAAAFLVLAAIFGGVAEQGSWQEAIVLLASLPVLALALLRLDVRAMDARQRAALALVLAIVALPLLQLMPLPPAVWTRLPGRSSILAGFAAAGVATPWMPISLSPVNTWQGALALLPALAMFFSVMRLGRRSRRALTFVLMGVAFMSVVLGLAQLALGPESPVQFYGEQGAARGFFVSRNHYAALLYVVVPFTAAWAVGLAADRRPEIVVGAGLCLILLASLLLGLGMAQSRAGVALAVLAGLASFALARTGAQASGKRGGRRLIVTASLVGVLLILQFASIGLLRRMEADPLQDARWQYVAVTWRAVKDFFPFGSGFGSYESLYKAYEPIDKLGPLFANKTHDDYVQSLLEGGVAAAAIGLGFFAWFVWSAVPLWRGDQGSTASALDRALARAASIAILLLLVHSAVDYPLRSAALSTVFAMCCAFMLPARKSASETAERRVVSDPRRGRHRSRDRRPLADRPDMSIAGD